MLSFGALGLQIACWVGGLVLLVLLHPARRLRLTDPGVLFMFWSFLYLVYPSLFWFSGGKMPLLGDIPEDTANLLFMLHILFMVGFLSIYLPLRNVAPWQSRELNLDWLPPGWPLFLLGLLIPFIQCLARVLGGGPFLPETSYGEDWAQKTTQVEAARAAGGLAYLWIQVESKLLYYRLLLQGIGAGLILTRTLYNRRGIVLAIGAITFGTGWLLVMTNSARSLALIPCGIAILIADFLLGPLKWRYIGVIGLAGLVFFEFWGVYRNMQDKRMDSVLEVILSGISSEGDQEGFTEFSCMLTKEAHALELFKTPEGLSYFGNELAALLPSQLNPNKFDRLPTYEILSYDLLGPDAAKGFGIAGTTIGSGYRFAGTIGVFFVGAFFGLILVSVGNWGVQAWPFNNHPPGLLRLGLIAGLFAWTFTFLRSDPGEVFVCLLHNLILPWVIISILLRGKTIWLKPLETKHPGEKPPIKSSRVPAVSFTGEKSSRGNHSLASV